MSVDGGRTRIRGAVLWLSGSAAASRQHLARYAIIRR